MRAKHQITLAAESASLARFREFISNGCQKARLDDDTCYDIQLAVDEACTNIIQHGYIGLDPGSIILSLQYGARQIVVRIIDFGHPFEPSEPPAPDVEAVFAAGNADGYGLYFIYRSMDVVTYDSTGDTNTLTMVKLLTKQEIQPAGAQNLEQA
jgi:anti-sigma regulatory factor (Ser/Thr protein kinase)